MHRDSLSRVRSGLREERRLEMPYRQSPTHNPPLIQLPQIQISPRVNTPSLSGVGSCHVTKANGGEDGVDEVEREYILVETA